MNICDLLFAAIGAAKAHIDLRRRLSLLWQKTAAQIVDKVGSNKKRIPNPVGRLTFVRNYA